MAKHIHGSNVLFIARNTQGLASLISYLGTRKVKSWTSSSVQDIGQKIVENRINVVFLSIAVKGMPVQSVIDLLIADFKIPTIVFSEENTHKAELELIRLKVPNKILPPNQNAKVWRALSTVLENFTAGKEASTQAYRESLLPSNASEISTADLPKGGRWTKLDPDPKSPPPYTYKLILPRGSGSARSRYYYVGSAQPGVGKDDGTFYIAGKLGKFTSAVNVEGNVEEEAGNDELPYRLEQMGSELGHRLQNLEVEKLEPTNVVEVCLRESAEFVERMTRTMVFDRTPATQFMVSLVKTETTEGYLLTTLSQEQVLECTAFSEMLDILRVKLNDRGEKIIEMSPPLLFEQNMLEFVSWAQASSFYVVLAGQEECRFSYVYISAPLDDVLLTLESDDMFSVPVTSMRSDINLTFDLYLHLPKNGKYIRYRKKGTMFSEETLAAFEQHNIPRVYLKKEDKNLYYAYRAAAFVVENRKAQGF